MLGFEAEAGVFGVDPAALAGDRPVQEVARVELEAGLGRRDFHRPAALGFGHQGRETELPAAFPEDEIMVVASFDLGDPFADGVRRGEVELESP